jgi:hypothetical protein
MMSSIYPPINLHRILEPIPQMLLNMQMRMWDVEMHILSRRCD